MSGAGLGYKWGPRASGRVGEAPRGSSRVSKPRAAVDASPARKPLRRCPHYITDIPATELASLRRGGVTAGVDIKNFRLFFDVQTAV